MYFDGSLKLGEAGAGVLFILPDGKQLKYILQILWQATNNEAEYEALIQGLRVAISLEIKRLLVYGDSAVVVNQVNKDWDCTKETMDAYCAEVRKLEKHFQGLEILHVLRDSNVVADILAKLGSDRAKVPPCVFVEELLVPFIKQPGEITPDTLAKLESGRAKVPPGVFVEELSTPSIKQPGEITPDTPTTSNQILVIAPAWTQVFIDYIKENKLLADKEEATWIVRRSKNYVLVGDKLYRRAASLGVLLKCITAEEGKEIHDEIRSGCCGNHAASRALVGKAFRSGFYWPTALKDAKELIRRCKGCQMFAR
jgi:ribonuclease HI